MIITKVADKWVICNYNYIALLPITEYLQNEYQVREHFKAKINAFCTGKATPNTIEDVREHAFGPFIDARMLTSIINVVKVILYEGLTEQRIEVFKDPHAEGILVHVNEDFTVSIETITEDILVPLVTPIPLDDLEFYERDDVHKIIEGMTDSVAEECHNKANALRAAVSENPVTELLSDCDITLLMDEGLRQLLETK